MHPIAADLTAPDVIRRAFARVTAQVVRRFDDGSEGIVNVTGDEQTLRVAVAHSARIGRTFASGRTLVAVDVREVPRCGPPAKRWRSPSRTRKADCRNDSERFTAEELDEFHGHDGWIADDIEDSE